VCRKSRELRLPREPGYLPDTRVCSRAAQELNMDCTPAGAVRDIAWEIMVRLSRITASNAPLSWL